MRHIETEKEEQTKAPQKSELGAVNLMGKVLFARISTRTG